MGAAGLVEFFFGGVIFAVFVWALELGVGDG